MARTNVEIDEELIQRVMKQHGIKTKREAIEYALRRVSVVPMTREEALAMRGTGWPGDLAEFRRLPKHLRDDPS